jgi:fibronectin-binding autotransporter adhesin
MSSNQGSLRRPGRAGAMPRAEIGRAREAGRRRLRPAVLMLEDRRLMATFTVTSAADAMTGGSPDAGTLRWAVEQADGAAGPSVIDFALGTAPATISLSDGQLELSGTGGPIAIVGPGAAALTVDGGVGRVLQIDPGIAASVSGLTISGGSVAGPGGGVYNLGTAELKGVVLTDNASNTDSFDPGGGGLDNEGTATLTDCTISGNTSGKGGGLRNHGTLMMIDCTVSGNTCTWNGGGLYNYGVATLDGCRVSGNSGLDGSGSGIFSIGPGFNGRSTSITLTHCTIADNAGTGLINDFEGVVGDTSPPRRRWSTASSAATR